MSEMSEGQGSSRGGLAVGLVLVALAGLLLCFRFVQLDLASFARDEPQFLHASREQIRTGHWLTANPLFGNMGLRYGPTAFWFYGLVQMLLGDGPRTAILAMGLVLTAAYAAFGFALRRALDEDLLFLGALLTWMASSPYQFHWSRLAWDLTSNACVFGAAALLCTYRELRPVRAVALGLLLGLAVSTHPSVLPFVGAAALILLVELRARRVTPRALLLAAGAALLVTLPYLFYLSRARILGRGPRRPFALADLGGRILDTPRLATTWSLDYFFEGSWLDFVAWLGVRPATVSALGMAGLVLVTAATLAGLVVACRSADVRWRRMGQMAALTWAGSAALLTVLGLDRHPHYHFSSAWAPVFGVGALVAVARRRWPRSGSIALAALVLLALAQFALIVGWMGYVEARGGTRTAAYGTTLVREELAVRAICARSETTIVVRNETALFAFPYQYLASVEPACLGKTLILCPLGPGVGGPGCPTIAPGSVGLRLSHAEERGGAVRVD